MKNNNLNPISLTITAVALIILTVLLVQAAHRKAPFVPTPPPVVTTANIPTINSGTSPTAPATTTTPQPISICYVSTGPNKASLKITTADGQHATGSLSETLGQQNPSSGTLDGTLTGSTDGSSAVFTGQYVDAMSITGTPKTITLGQNQAQIGSLTIPRVACAQ